MGGMGTKTVRRAYRFRFYPTAEQENLLRRTLGCCRKVYNLALDARSTAWTARKERVTYSDTSRMLTEWKRTDEYSYLSEVPSVPLQQSLRHLQRAFSNFFGKTGDYPKFKAKRGGGSATYAATAFTWDWERQALTLAKMKEPLPVRWSRTLPRKAQPSSVTVSLDAAGRWHVSILVEDTVIQLPHADGMVGIDLGTEHFAILSTGEKIDNPRHLKRHLKKLELAQRKLSRTRKGSNNHEKARLKVAKAYAKVKDCRTDYLHKLSTRIIRENQTVVIEDLAVRNMTRRCNPKPETDKPGGYLPNGQAAKSGLNRSILDAGWRRFRSMLEYEGRMVRATAHGHRPLVSQQPTLPHLRQDHRQETALHPRMGLPTLQRPSRQGRQRREKHTIRRAGGTSLRGFAHSRSNAPVARESSKPYRKNLSARRGITGFQSREEVNCRITSLGLVRFVCKYGFQVPITMCVPNGYAREQQY